MNNKVSEMQEWGSFALVAYIPDPLGSFLNSLRQVLPGEENPHAHITLLPPRPLKSPVEAASLQAQKILAKFQPFSVELAEVCTFPETNVVYLEISEGSAQLHELHDALNSADLAHDEDFEFKPHLTLSGPVGSCDIGQVRTEAARCLAFERHLPYLGNTGSGGALATNQGFTERLATPLGA